MKRKLLQLLADGIINGLKETKDVHLGVSYYSLGHKLDLFAIKYFNIYLD